MSRLLRASAFWLTAILLLSATACGGPANAEPSPPTIHYGEDTCEFCGMIVSEAGYAAAYVTRDGRGHIFDDIGDMLKSHRAEQSDVIASFVHDYEDKSWMRAETAHYVHSDQLPAPMLSGLAAFASPEKAAALAAGLQGQVLTFDEVLARYQEMASTLMEGGGEHHSQHR